jgi:hypothetical protein
MDGFLLPFRSGERVRRFMRKVAAAVSLALREPGSLFLTVRMAAWVAVVSIVAPRVSLTALFRLTETRHRWKPSTRLTPQEIARGIDRVLNAGFVTDGPCWKRAAVLRRYLQLNGIETEVVFGVRRQAGDLDGHAWLEHEGAPFLERESPQEYAITFRHPPPR